MASPDLPSLQHFFGSLGVRVLGRSAFHPPAAALRATV